MRTNAPAERRTFITLPGLGGSEDSHWQSLWERADDRFTRFEPSDWEQPDLLDWIDALNRTLLGKTDAVLVAHSLSCLLVAHWAHRAMRSVAGALLVSVPDPEGPEFPAEARSFRDVPDVPLPFPALIVASTDDPYGTLAYSRARAKAWGAGLIKAGPLGHINASSGIGDWPEGRRMLDAFCAGLWGSPVSHRIGTFRSNCYADDAPGETN